MPILKHAKKKLRQDKKRTIKNKKIKDAFKRLVKGATADKTQEALSKAFSAVDKAAKKNILSKNKASRMKSSLAKHLSSSESASPKTEAKVKSKKTAKAAPKASKSSGAKKTKPSSKK